MSLNVLLSSAGRRPYLVRWFREALVMNGVPGKVVVADHDALAPARSLADHFIEAPRVDDPTYLNWLSSAIEVHQIGLAISVNDFELSRWSEVDSSSRYFEPLVRLGAGQQRMVEDKFEMYLRLGGADVQIPRTVIAGTSLAETDLSEVVVKGRFGSGSRGLAFTDMDGVEAAVCRALGDVTDRAGDRPSNLDAARDLVVIQERIRGQEFGLDVVSDWDGRFVTVLARKKLGMRSGETDKAITVDPAPFQGVGRAIARALGHRGSVDVDVLVDSGGSVWVIDVNPRFGGGYPFSHVGGAHVPSAYVAWATGRVAAQHHLVSLVGVESAKYVEITQTGAMTGYV